MRHIGEEVRLCLIRPFCLIHGGHDLLLPALEFLLLGSDQQTLGKVKRWAISVAVGLVLINMAEPIVDWLQSIK